jgi:hypothetical protein
MSSARPTIPNGRLRLVGVDGNDRDAHEGLAATKVQGSGLWDPVPAGREPGWLSLTVVRACTAAASFFAARRGSKPTGHTVL